MVGYDRRKANRISLWAVAVIAVLLGTYVAVESFADPVSVAGGELSLRAMFGYRVALSDIEGLDLVTSPLGKRSRVIGLDAFGLFSEGDFNIEGLGKARIFARGSAASYVLIKTADRNYVIGLGSPEKDQLLYDRIKLGMRR
jgi:hypothetical protein